MISYVNPLTGAAVHCELVCDKAIQEGIDFMRNGVAGHQRRW